MIGKLGKKAARHDRRTLMLAKYIQRGMPMPPPMVGWGSKVADWGMAGNDNAGDCTYAGAAHASVLWNSYTGLGTVPTTEQVLATYSQYTGFNPDNPETDQGAVEVDVLNAWQKDGYWGQKLDAFAALQPQSANEIRDSIWLFGCAYLGLALPNTAQNQDVWALVPGPQTGDNEPGSWGGHCVLCVGYDERTVQVVTWGAIKLATWEWLAAFMDESYALLSQDWIEKTGAAPSGFDMTALKMDLASIGSV